MTLLAVPIIAVFALIISMLCLVIIFMLIRRHNTRFSVYESQSQTHELLLNNLQSANNDLKVIVQELSLKLEQTLTENTLVSKQLEHRIKSIQSQFNSQQELISQLQTDKGDDKFYSRAIKLAKIGADIDEIVTECELPYAEVEMLISVYQNKASG
jgi:cell shape-determining protein MreC